MKSNLNAMLSYLRANMGMHPDTSRTLTWFAFDVIITWYLRIKKESYDVSILGELGMFSRKIKREKYNVYGGTYG